MRIKNVFLFLISLILLVISGCENKSEQIYKEYTDNPDNTIKNMNGSLLTESPDEEVQNVNEDISGDLVIYTLEPSALSSLDSWFTKDFNEQYPNVHVSFVGPDINSSEDIYTEAAVALMSGTAGDIINLSLLPYTQYARNNLLEDLNPYMENDPAFHREDYYTNIFEALEYKDKLYGIPLGFWYWCLRFNQNLLDVDNADISGFHTINYKNIADIYHQIYLKKEDLIISKGWNQVIFELNELGCYIDDENSTARFNSKEFIDYLNEINRIPWADSNGAVIYDYLLDLDNNELCGFFISDYVRSRNAGIFMDKTQKMTAPIPISASDGDNPFQATYFLGITSASKNKELAWLFLKSWLQEKDIKDMDESRMDNHYLIDGYSINRKNTLKLLEKAFGPGHEEEIALIDLWNSERNSTNIISDKNYLLLAIDEINKEFYSGRITAEECAAQIQERVEIYLKE